MTLEETLVSVWRQTLVENLKAVDLAGRSFPVRRTARRGLRQVDFDFEGNELRGIEQNPETRSRWAQLARGGAKVMQFLAGGPAGERAGRRYVAVVVNGKVTLYR
jgi:hypothetical protein